MSASYENRYMREPRGARLALKLDRLSEWHALEVQCTACFHIGYITVPTLRTYYARHHKVSDAEHRFKCSKCRKRGSVTWNIVKQRR